MRIDTMPPRDFDDDYPKAPERAPGVYTRSEGRSPNDLDILWSGSKVHKEERSPFIFFVAGFILAAILTSAVFLVLNNRPNGDNAPDKAPDYLQSPVEDPLSGPNGQDNASSLEKSSSSMRTPGEGTTSRSEASSARASHNVPYKTYVVKSGDTLGSIAGKVYGSSSPDYVDKLQRANNLSSPDKLRLDQELVVPPMN